MNGWDLLTWFMAFVLAGSAVLLFVYFLRDAGNILTMDERSERGAREPRD
jgi:hypothetical protein